MTPGTVSLSAVAEKGYPRSVRILMGYSVEITASQAKEGVMQSATLADGHCVRHTFRVRHDTQEHDSLDRHVHGEHVERRRSHHGGRGRLPKQLTARFWSKRLTHATKFTSNKTP